MLENSFLLNNAPNKLDTIVPIGHWYTIQTININFFLFYLLFYYLYYYCQIKKNWLQIQIAKKKGDESALRNHSTLKMIVSVYHVNSLNWRNQIILCGGTKYLTFLPRIVYCFWFPKECWGYLVAPTGWRQWGWPMEFPSFCHILLKGLKGDNASSCLQGPT